ncbi:ammonium transporter, Amt family [Mytilus galloprovincialis]|uniref:Ammonium transporter n=1 Tax=Mytilus galloprovincialis TaxID=29158 RepID=A0A8B6D1E6_MYTGA|nr:ammonium transporter, Amt family [Mytilus galloprovincialis]
MSSNTTAEEISSLSFSLDQFFLIIMGMVVYFMQCGFAFLEAGAVRSKNVTNILIKNVMDSFVSGIAYWIFGYAFAYGDGGKAQKFIGATYFASYDMPMDQYASFFFQYTFAATAATIVSGAVAERCEFIAYFAYSFVITGFIYPVVTHWAWGNGWLVDGYDYGGDIGQIAYQDFAGSGVVHVLGGVCAFIGAALLGPRIGRFQKGSNVIGTLRGHSVPIAALGGFVLFFGFLAFNGGSQLTISSEGDGAAVAVSVVNTIISASFAAFGSLIINRLHIFGNTWSLLVTINGALTGMVAACAGCNQMHPWSAAILGLFSAMSYTLWSTVMKKLNIDDPLDAVAVHFGGGITGVVLIAFLDKDDGILFNWDRKSGLKLGWQFVGLAAIIAWSALFSLLIFGILKCFGVLRVSREIEDKGLDIPKHNEPAYPVEAYGHGHVEKLIQILETQPMVVTQGYTNIAYENKSFKIENEYEDKGVHETPETSAAVRIRNGNPSNGHRTILTISNGTTPSTVDDATKL